MKLLLPLLCGMAAAWAIRVPFFVFPAVAAVLLAGIGLVRTPGGRGLLVQLLLGLLGAAKMTLDLSVSDPAAIERYVRADATVALTCRVTDTPREGPLTLRFIAEAESLRTGRVAQAVHGAVAVVLRRTSARPESRLAVGRRLTVEGELAYPARARNPGEFDPRAYLLIHGIHCELMQAPDRPPRFAEVVYADVVDRMVIPVRSAIAARIDSLFGPDEATFLRGLIIGDRSDLGAEIKTAFINAGVMHILAVSGLHVAVVVLMLVALIRLLRLPELAGFVVLAASLLYYIPLTGGSPSVARSVLMALVLLGSKTVQRKVDVFNALAASAVVLLLIDAKQLFDPGFQLSYMAVVALVTVFPILQPGKRGGNVRRLLGALWAGLAVSVAASIGTFPITAYHFGRISLVGIAANVIVVPLSNAVLGLGMLAVAASFLWHWLGTVYAAAASFGTTSLLAIVRWFGELPLASTNVSLSVGGVVASYAGMALLLGCLSRRYRAKAILLALCAADAWVLIWLLRPAPLPVMRITVLDIGQGDAIVLEFPDKSAMLLDAGPATGASRGIVAPYLARSGIRMLDAVIVSHPHEDHLGGMPLVLRSIPVRTAVDAGFGPDSRLAAEYVRLCDSLRITRRLLTRGWVIPSPPMCRMYLLHPTPEIARGKAEGGSGLNNQSLVIRLVYGATSILLSGDAEAVSEEEIVRTYGAFVRSDILKAGHHGSITSSSDAYLAAVNPGRAVISVGRRNRFHHPSPVVVARLRALGCEVARTDSSGAVVLESDGRSWRTVAWR